MFVSLGNTLYVMFRYIGRGEQKLTKIAVTQYSVGSNKKIGMVLLENLIWSGVYHNIG